MEKGKHFRENGADWSDKEALARAVEPWPFGRTGPMGYGELLALIAAGSRVPLLADTEPAHTQPNLWANLLSDSPSGLRGHTLREVIDYAAALDLVADMGPATWSKPLGRFLAVKDRAPTRAALSLGRGTAEVLADWDRLTAGKKTVSLAQAAAMFSELTPTQWIWMEHTRWSALARELWFSGDILSGETGRRLLAGEEVSLSDLSDYGRSLVLGRALRDRPWLRQDDLAQTTIALVSSSGDGDSAGPGKAIVVSYHLPDDPADRDILRTYPLSFAVPAREPKQKRDPVIAPAQDVPFGTVATLAQTGWLYQGSATMGKTRSAMVVDDCTKEMELLEVGSTFRGMRVTEVGELTVTLIDADGRSVTMTLQPRAPAEPQL